MSTYICILYRYIYISLRSKRKKTPKRKTLRVRYTEAAAHRSAWVGRPVYRQDSTHPRQRAGSYLLALCKSLQPSVNKNLYSIFNIPEDFLIIEISPMLSSFLRHGINKMNKNIISISQILIRIWQKNVCSFSYKNFQEIKELTKGNWHSLYFRRKWLSSSDPKWPLKTV